MEKLEKNLKKLTFNVWASVGDELIERSSEAAQFSFIYGIGTEGLSDFEMAIDGLGLQEVFDLEVEKSRLNSYFGWLYRAMGANLILPNSDAAVKMKFELHTVSTPEPREIVTAMAELQSHGGCSSDCGCGCH
jgi:hypothetical protein